MRRKQFSQVDGSDALIRRAVIEALGAEPDNFIQSALGGSVEGAPNPAAAAEESRLVDRLDQELAEALRTAAGDRWQEDGPTLPYDFD